MMPVEDSAASLLEAVGSASDDTGVYVVLLSTTAHGEVDNARVELIKLAKALAEIK